jgi:predicted nucleic acid-binding Zn ribbon protein
MTLDEAAKKKAQRATIVLYTIMILFIVLPFVIFSLLRHS